MDYQVLIKDLFTQGLDIGLKVLGAIIVWIVGSWLIRFTNNLLTRALSDKHLEETLVKYASSALNILLKLILNRGPLQLLRLPDHHYCRSVGRCRSGHRHHVGGHDVESGRGRLPGLPQTF